jgi:hypothetical protein
MNKRRDGAETAHRKATRMQSRIAHRKKVILPSTIALVVLNIPDAANGCTEKQREDRSFVFQWARNHDPPRCAYWVVAECPNIKNGAN